jgi:HAD superfamily hydrolase (TIGR01459 family)
VWTLENDDAAPEKGSSSMSYDILPGFSTVATRYDIALIDLWGVVHNGKTPYPGVLDCLEQMRVAGITRILLSNAPRRAPAVARQIEGFGIPRNAYDHIVSSGGVTFDALRGGLPALLGRSRYFYCGPEKDTHFLEGLDFAPVSGIENAAFLLVAGLRNDETETAEDYDDVLRIALARDLPLVCVNPDISVMRGTRILPCAGAIAARYSALGGQVIQFGKPFAPAYEACMDGRSVPRSRVVAIGDSPRTDIAGANAFGIDSIFVTGGLHQKDVGDPIDANRLAAFIDASGNPPTAVLPGLRWAASA